MWTLAQYTSNQLLFRHYVDDCAAWRSSRHAREAAEDILEAAASMQEWFDSHGLDINQQKSILWSTHPLARRLLQDTVYGSADAVRDLGYDVTFAGSSMHHTTEQRMEDSLYSCKRMELLQPPRGTAEALIQRSVLVKGLWGCEFQDLPQGMVDKLRKAISRALGHKHGQGRTPYATQILASRHIIHPQAVLWMSQLKVWHEYLRTGPPAAEVQVLWRRGLEQTAFGVLKNTWTATVQSAAHSLEWICETPFVWRFQDRQYTLAEIEEPLFKHLLRDAVRAWAKRNLSRLRNDYTGIDQVQIPELQKVVLRVRRLGNYQFQYILDGGGQDLTEQARRQHREIDCP
eukprot:468139-Amphidinium_carterae.1